MLEEPRKRTPRIDGLEAFMLSEDAATDTDYGSVAEANRVYASYKNYAAYHEVSGIAITKHDSTFVRLEKVGA